MLLNSKPNVFRCNDCESKVCNKSYSIQDSRGCTSYLSPSKMKLPILLHCLESERKATKISKVLGMFNFQIREVNSYPFFNLVLGR
jgi:hypothetical protein